MKKDIQQLFNEFIWECEFVKRLRPDTLQSYRQAFSTFAKLTPGVSLESLTPNMITTFFKTLQERKRIVGRGTVKIGVKTSTVGAYWRKLTCFFQWLELRNYISVNPFKVLTYPTPAYEDAKYLKKREIEKIITAIHASQGNSILVFKRNLVLFYLLLYCGLRKEEVMLLQIPDIDFERRLLTIRKESSKSGKTRQLPLHSTTLMHLKDYLKQRNEYTTPYLIVSKGTDDKLSYAGLKHLVDSIRKRSGVQFHLHQFRHTFAVNFLKTTNNIGHLRQLMGHKDIRMTMVYLRCINVDEIRGEIELMNIDNFLK